MVNSSDAFFTLRLPQMIPYHLIEKHKISLSCGSGVGLIANMACRYNRSKNRDFLTVCAFVGTVGIIELVNYIRCIKKELQEVNSFLVNIQTRVDLIPTDVSFQVEAKIKIALKEVFEAIDKVPQKTLDLMQQQIDHIKDLIKNMTPSKDPVVYKQIQNLDIAMEKLTTQIKLLIEMLNKMQNGKLVTKTETEEGFISSFKKMFLK